MDSEDPHFISCQGVVSGPHPLDQIRAMLKDGRIHSLYRIQVNGEWVLLRDYLAGISRAVRATARGGAFPPRRESRDGHAPDRYAAGSHREAMDGGGQIPIAKVIEEEPTNVWPATQFSSRSIEVMGARGDECHDEGEAGSVNGFAVTSFVLSFLFFIPGLNLLAWVIGLIFGHLALAEQRGGSRVNQSWMAWFGVWMSYIMGGMFLFQVILLSFLGGPLNLLSQDEILLQIHVNLFSHGAVAAINGALLLWAVRLLTKEIPCFARCYISALLSLSAGSFAASFALFYSGSIIPEFDSAVFLVLGIALVSFWAVQAAIWKEMIRRRDGSPLGFGHASVASIFSVILLMFFYLLLYILQK